MLNVNVNVKLDRDRLRADYALAKPIPFLKIDDFLPREMALAIAGAYPHFDEALHNGKSFMSANERKEVQVTNSSLFPPAVAELHELLSSPAFLDDVGFITGLPRLIADGELIGGGCT